MEAWKVQSNIEVHGIRWTAERLVKRVCFTHAYWLMFGRLPRK